MLQAYSEKIAPNAPSVEDAASRDGGQALPHAVGSADAFLNIGQSETLGTYDHLIDQSSPAAACLQPFLAALNWIGGARQLAEALPHFDSISSVDDLRVVLANMNMITVPHRLRLSEIRTDILPCLYQCDDQSLLVIISMNDDGRLYIYDGAERSFRDIDAASIRGTAYLVQPTEATQEASRDNSQGWTRGVLNRFSRTFGVLFALTFVINLLALALPIYIMAVYEKAIAAKSVLTLVSLFAGVCLVLALEFVLRKIRGRALTYLGTRIETLIVVRTFQQLLYMPLAMTESAPAGAQVSKIRQFEGLRDVFSGSIANALLDLPFLMIFVIAIFAIGGPLGFIPVALILAYLAVAATSIPMMRFAMQQHAMAKTRRRNFLLEMTENHATIRDCQAEDTWLKRFKALSRDEYLGQLRLQKLSAVVQSLSLSLVAVAGAAVVGLGALLAIEGDLSLGALIASTALIWRGLAPLQSSFLSLSQIGQATASMKQLNNLLRIPLERTPGSRSSDGRAFVGKLEARDLSLRYSDKSLPALRGVSLHAEAGEMIAVAGFSGAGKSALLKTLAGLQSPQGGSVKIDDLDIRQFDAAEVHQSIGYVPQKLSLFYGTIAQNLTLAYPSASRDDIERALSLVGALDEAKSLPDGIDTRIQGTSDQRFSSGFLKQIALARAFIKPAQIYILDEPNSSLDFEHDMLLMKLLQRIKGTATIILVSHRPSHLKLADRVIILQRGSIVASGPPEQVVPLLLDQTK